MANPKRELSKTEWSIMSICWRLGKCTARQVYEDSLQQKRRSYQTVKTMLDRLADKGYLERERLGPLWLYKPAVSRSKLVGRAVENFIETVLDNTFAPLLVHLARRTQLTEDELQELKELVRNAEAKENGGGSGNA